MDADNLIFWVLDTMTYYFVQNRWKIFFLAFVFSVFSILFFTGFAYINAKPNGESPIIEATKSFLLGVGGAGTAVTILLAVLNSINDGYMRVIENTFNLIARWDDPHLASARKFTRKLKDSGPTMSNEEFLKKIDEDDELHHSIVLVCNYFDQIRISSEMNRIDIKSYNKSLGPVMEDYYHRLKPYVQRQGRDSMKDWDKVLSLSKAGRE